MGFVVIVAVVVVVVAVLSSPLSLSFYYYYQYCYCVVWYLCYHYSLLLYQFLSLSLSLVFFLSLLQSIKTQPPLFLAVFFIPGKKQSKDSLRKTERERERVCQIFLYIDTGRFCIFCFSFVYDFSFSFQSLQAIQEKVLQKSLGSLQFY